MTRLIEVYFLLKRYEMDVAMNAIDICILIDTFFSSIRCLLAWNDSVDIRPQLKQRQFSEASASPFSRLFFLWIWSLLQQGYNKKELHVDDLPPLHPQDMAETLFGSFQASWCTYPHQSLPRHLHRVCWKTFYYSAFLMFIVTTANIASPLIFHELLVVLDQPMDDIQHPLGLACFWVATLTSSSILLHQFWSVAVRCGMHTRSILQQFTFEKSLKLSAASRQEYSVGMIQSLLSMDASRLCDNYFICFLHWDTWSAVLTLIFAFYYLFHLLSYSSLVWLAIMLLYAPCGAACSTRIKNHSQEHQSHRDKRTSILTQVLDAVLTMKSRNWEAWSEARICKARENELHELKWKSLYDTYNKSLLIVAQVVAPVCTFLIFVHVERRKFDVPTAFAALAWFQTASAPLLRLPQVVVAIIDAQVSFKRLEAFFRAPERADDSKDQQTSHLYHAIEIKQISCRWSAQRNLFKELTLVIPKGQFVVCYGAVGSGKSSFLELCLRLPEITQGNVHVHGSIAYCPQQPWIQNVSVRENILFGLPMDRMWYKMTLHMCVLDEDLLTWSNGDSTLAGVQGCYLSGGQKQRISLARAIYSRRDILLLDDILASLDSKVGHEIFQRCLCSPALSYTTRILVVNQLQYMQHPAIDRVLYFEELHDGSLRIQNNTMANSSQEEFQSTNQCQQNSVDTVVLKDDQPSTKSAELTTTGALDLKIVKLYLDALGSRTHVILYGIVLVLEHGLIFASTLFLSKWCSHMEETMYQNTYIALALGTIVATVGNRIYYVILSLSASTRVHQSLVHKLMHASMEFFDTYDQGMILNRCMKDISAVDEALPYVVSTFLFNSLEIIMSLVSVAWTTPLALTLVVLLIYPYLVIYNMYRWPARDLKRLQSMARAPIVSFYNEISSGTSTIIAFDASYNILQKSMDHVNHSVRSYWPSLIANQWVTVWLELVGLLIVAVSTFSSVWFHFHGGLATASVGIVLTYASQLPSRIGWMLKMLAAIEVDFIALERIDQLASTAAFYSDKRQMESTIVHVPTQGMVEIRQLNMSYGMTQVLRGIDVDIPANAKVAIVGRTGSGKTSMVRALLGLYPIQGVIRIDGLDLSTLPKSTLLHDVFSFVPQDAKLLGHTVLDALVGDAMHDYDGIQRVLLQVGLWNVIDKLQDGLGTCLSKVVLSGGEMQLFCLARALLGPAFVLICDEATAYVDADSNEKIHDLLFQLEKTVISICHRIDHVMKYDLVLVLDHGCLVEYGEPRDLLARFPEGSFAALMNSTE